MGSLAQQAKASLLRSYGSQRSRDSVRVFLIWSLVLSRLEKFVCGGTKWEWETGEAQTVEGRKMDSENGQLRKRKGPRKLQGEPWVVGRGKGNGENPGHLGQGKNGNSKEGRCSFPGPALLGWVPGPGDLSLLLAPTPLPLAFPPPSADAAKLHAPHCPRTKSQALSVG